MVKFLLRYKIDYTLFYFMIKKPAAAQQFLQNPGQTTGILLYGSDEGQIQQFAKLLRQTVTNGDTFCYEEINAAQLDKEPGLLSDTLLSPSLMGGKRLVRLREAGHSHTKYIKDVLGQWSAQDAILLVDSNATKKGSLQKLFEENTDSLVAVPCYVPEGSGKQQQIQQLLQQQSLSLPTEAIQYLNAILPGDGQLLSMEVEKLALYAGETKQLTLQQVERCCSGLFEASFDDFSYNVLEGNVANALNALKRLEQDGIPALVLVRTTLNLSQQLLKCLNSNQPPAMAANQLRPPLFFKLKPRFIALLQRWSSTKLLVINGQLLKLEKRLKTVPTEQISAIIGQAILGIRRANGS